MTESQENYSIYNIIYIYIRECWDVVASVIYKEKYSYNIFYECLAVMQTGDKILSDEKAMQNAL
jgi:hypothetical protein